MRTLVQVCLLGLWLLSPSAAFSQRFPGTGQPGHPAQSRTRFFSGAVGDTFYISVSLPDDYSPGKKHYPVVYLLDANLYGDIMATVIRRYSEVGLAPDVILVGIGYRDLAAMDSLRSRDNTYPVAFREYEMGISGGADKFLGFLRSELIPAIDSAYSTDTGKRILMGHSLGGYFVAYALLQALSGKEKTFSSYIAASPSLHYNKYYLLNELGKAGAQKARGPKAKAYFTFGGLEDKEDADEPGTRKVAVLSQQLTRLFTEKQAGRAVFKCDVYSNLGHMDMSIPTFIKGLQWALDAGK